MISRNGPSGIQFQPAHIGAPTNVARLDKLAPGVSYVVFDGNVNSGVSQSIKWLQRALQGLGLYQGAIDGIIGQGRSWRRLASTTTICWSHASSSAVKRSSEL